MKRGKYPNGYRVDGESAYIYCPDKTGMFHEVALDATDLERVLSAGKWCVANFYPKGFRLYAYLGPSHPTIYLHRFLLGSPTDLVVDHRNHDGLDNHGRNIFATTHALNQLNRQASRKARPSGKKWLAQVQVDKKTVRLGLYATAEDAERRMAAFVAEKLAGAAGLEPAYKGVEIPELIQLANAPVSQESTGAQQ